MENLFQYFLSLSKDKIYIHIIYILIYTYYTHTHTHTQKESNLAESTAIVDTTRFSHVWQSTAVKKPR